MRHDVLELFAATQRSQADTEGVVRVSSQRLKPGEVTPSFSAIDAASFMFAFFVSKCADFLACKTYLKVVGVAGGEPRESCIDALDPKTPTPALML